MDLARFICRCTFGVPGWGAVVGALTRRIAVMLSILVFAAAVFAGESGARPAIAKDGLQKSACSAADFVQKHEGTRREVMEDHRGLEHLHHERGFAAGNVV